MKKSTLIFGSIFIFLILLSIIFYTENEKAKEQKKIDEAIMQNIPRTYPESEKTLCGEKIVWGVQSLDDGGKLIYGEEWLEYKLNETIKSNEENANSYTGENNVWRSFIEWAQEDLKRYQDFKVSHKDICAKYGIYL